MHTEVSEHEKLQLALQQLHKVAKRDDEAHRRDIRHNVETRWPATQLFIDTWFDLKNKAHAEERGWQLDQM